MAGTAQPQAGDDDEYVLVTVDEYAQELLRGSAEYDISGLDTPTPTMRLGGHELIGQYEEDTTAMMFADASDASGAREAGAASAAGGKSVSLQCKTTLRLKFSFVTEPQRPAERGAS